MEPTSNATSYELLQVHPAAPLDLITAAYWRLAGQAQTRRASDHAAELALHLLTRAYQVLADPAQRALYDAAIGIKDQALAPKLPHRRRGRRGRTGQHQRIDAGVDYYDILRVVPEAEPSIIAEAYSTLRNYYVRLVNSGYSKADLLDFLEEAYAVTSNAESRREYDDERNRGSDHSVADAGKNGQKPAPVQSAAASPPSTATAAERSSIAAPAERTAPQDRSPAVPATQTDLPQRARAGPTAAEEGSRGGLLSSIGSAGGVIGALGRQFGSLSRREQQQVEEKLAQREQQQVDTVEAEEALLLRLSATAASSDKAQGAAAPLARLTLIEGPGSGATFELSRFPLTLGGDGDCDITLPGLAARQARLLYRDGRFVVYNLASPDSSAETAPWWILESGDDLTVGPYKLRFTATRD